MCSLTRGERVGTRWIRPFLIGAGNRIWRVADDRFPRGYKRLLGSEVTFRSTAPWAQLFHQEPWKCWHCRGCWCRPNTSLVHWVLGTQIRNNCVCKIHFKIVVYIQVAPINLTLGWRWRRCSCICIHPWLNHMWYILVTLARCPIYHWLNRYAVVTDSFQVSLESSCEKYWHQTVLWKATTSCH